MEQTKSLIVTGAGAGIGRAVLMHFHGLGWRVIGLDRDAAALDELRAALPDSTASLIECDVGRESAVKEAFAQMGDQPLGVLVNNAGIADPYCGPLEDLSLDDWHSWIDASLTGAFLCTRAALPLLRKAEQANVINISSTRAIMSEPETYAYSAAKGGLDALTRAMAVSLGPDIRVNAVRPGWIETGPWQKQADRSNPEHRPRDRKQHPAGRVGRPEDIADAVEWLVGAGFVTGQAINVDGGMTVKMIYED
ncbi:SDR family oxidoreductase [Porphyrobacter algicida]|uniref:SDR family oxidoreductase n=1 Tax=Qipengyuania algicida TaxID=1836209 RepID=A0A845ALD7_9SPHN|nr:SDR family NAD(P)-dependent oxidoreductase [Qipengyuania algicida]MXP27838.1 SDR family oxidoreductase [Qipengyuania algicida]